MMKKVLIAAGMIFCMASPVMADGDVKISGSVEIHYRHSSDKYASKGDDELKAEELYIKFKKEIADDVVTHIKLDGADMENGKEKDSHKYIEEAQVIFKNVADMPLDLVFGKGEMGFGQDYEKFLLSSRTHGFEVKKVWGLHGVYKVEGIGSFDLAFFERAPSYDNSSDSGGSYTKPDTSLTDSYVVRIKADKLVENLSIQASHAQIGKDEAAVGEEDENRTSVAGKFKAGSLGIHAEYTTFSDEGHVKDADLDVIQVGADYKIGKWLLKARHEMSDNDVDNDGSEEDRTAVGVSYYVSEKAFMTVEWETVSYDGAGVDDKDEVLVGVKFKF